MCTAIAGLSNLRRQSATAPARPTRTVYFRHPTHRSCDAAGARRYHVLTLGKLFIHTTG